MIFSSTLSDPQVRLLNQYFDPVTNPYLAEQTTIPNWQQSRDGISDADGGSGQNSLIEVAVHDTGTYYIQVGSEGAQTGTYTVHVNETGSHSRLNPGPITHYVPHGHSQNPTYSEPSGKDFPASTSTQGRVKPVGTRAHGKIGSNGDQDYFKIDMVAGYSYQIDVKGSEPSALGGTLGDPRVELRDSNGNAIATPSNVLVVTSSDSTSSVRISDNNSGEGSNARLEIDVSQNGRYYISVLANGANATGTYTVQVTILGQHGNGFPPQDTQQTISETAGNDLSSTATTTGYVQPSGDPATGNISTGADFDSYKVDLVAGQSYRIDCKGSEPTDRGGTLDDPLCVLLGRNGELLTSTTDVEATNLDQTTGILGLADNNRGAGKNSRIEIEVYTTGTYHVFISDHSSHATGTYTVVVTRTE